MERRHLDAQIVTSNPKSFDFLSRLKETEAFVPLACQCLQDDGVPYFNKKAWKCSSKPFVL